MNLYEMARYMEAFGCPCPECQGELEPPYEEPDDAEDAL